MPKVTYVCEICGALCEGHPNSHYCPECRGEIKRSTKRESQSNMKDMAAPKEEPGKPMTLGQISARARSLHMSYGQFVAKYGV